VSFSPPIPAVPASGLFLYRHIHCGQLLPPLQLASSSGNMPYPSLALQCLVINKLIFLAALPSL
jgi:hypothetical protein